MNRKTDEFKTSNTAFAVAVAVVAWVLADKFSNFIFHIIKIDIYHFQRNYNLLRMIWLIVDIKADKFKMFDTAIAIAIVIAMVAWVSDHKFINFICQKPPVSSPAQL